MDNDRDDYEGVVVTGSSVEDAVKRALLQLNVSLDAVDVEVLESGSRRVFGMGGGDARVRLRLRTRSDDEDDNANESADQADSRPEIDSATSDDVFDSESDSLEEDFEDEDLVDEDEDLADEDEDLVDEDEFSDGPSSERENVVGTVTTATGSLASGEGTDSEPRGRVERLDSGEDLERETEAVLESLLDRMGFVADFDLVTEDPLSYNITGDDDFERLIGQAGETLRSFDYLVNLIVGRRLGQSCRVRVDVNGYRRGRTDQLVELARTLADEVRETKEPVTLEAMPASERWVVHDALTDDPDVRTYSVGDGYERRVVIGPKA